MKKYCKQVSHCMWFFLTLSHSVQNTNKVLYLNNKCIIVSKYVYLQLLIIYLTIKWFMCGIYWINNLLSLHIKHYTQHRRQTRLIIHSNEIFTIWSWLENPSHSSSVYFGDSLCYDYEMNIYDLSLSSKKRNIIIIKRLVSNISLLVCFDFHNKAN